MSMSQEYSASRREGRRGPPDKIIRSIRPRPFMILRFALRVFLPGLLAAAALAAPASADPLPVVKGEVYRGSPEAKAAPALATTQAERPARVLRLAAPAESEFVPLEKPGLNPKARDIGFGRRLADQPLEGESTAFDFHAAGEVRVAKLRIVSPGAAALRVSLKVGGSAAPVTLRVTGSGDETRVLGPVSLAGPLGANPEYWTPVTVGEAQVIEIVSAAGSAPPAVTVEQVSHLVSGPDSRFAKTVADIGRSGSCNIDVACVANPSQALLQAASGVVQMLFTKRSGGSTLCTGTLLNDTDTSSQIPYLYGANHCFEASSAPYNTPAQMQQVANTLNTYYFFDAAACSSSQVPSFVQRFGGATYLYSNLSQDVLFLRLNDAPPAGTFLTGWNPNPMDAGNAITVLHHPQGDLKKFTTGTYTGNETLPAPLNASTGFQRVTYRQGTTEGGSSGGGVLTFDGSQYLLRGGLWGGGASCSAPGEPDFHSRFDIAYTTLKNWLQPSTGPAFNVTDMWWNAAESGWGLNLTHHASGQVFGVWYTYTAPGRPYWLILSGGQWVSGNVFTGKLYTVSGPHYAQPAFDPAKVILREVGVMTLNFSGDGNNGSFTWSVDGVTGVKLITRQPF